MSYRPRRFRSDLNFAIERNYAKPASRSLFRSAICTFAAEFSRPKTSTQTKRQVSGTAAQTSARARLEKSRENCWIFQVDRLPGRLPSCNPHFAVLRRDRASCFPFPVRPHRRVETSFRDKCKDHRYYEIIAQTLEPDFELSISRPGRFRRESSRHSAVVFCSAKSGEGFPGKCAALSTLSQRRFPRFLTMRLLMVGCAAGEGHLGACSARG